MIDIEPRYLAEIKTTLKAELPNCDVWVFGSRVRESATKYSDVDLAVIGEGRIDWRVLEKVKDSFARSDLPFMVDVLDWNAISREFQLVIERRYEVIQTGEAKPGESPD